VRQVGRGAAVLGAAGAAAALHRRRAARRAGGPARVPAPAAAGRLRTVHTQDGVALHVEEHGPEDAAATVVLAHGYVQSSRLWNGQVRDLVAARPELKVVTYDHRGHGRSGPTSREAASLEQLSRDLLTVLDAVAPTGPVLLGGHSMGGMTVMALAEQRPDLFGARVVGVALVGTSSGGLAQVGWGLPAPVAAAVRRAVPRLNELAVRLEARGWPRRVTPFEVRLIFGRGADPALVAEAVEVQRSCSAETMAAFFATFEGHDRREALAALADVPSVVVVGDRDLLCPIDHSRTIAAELPRGELVVFPGVGHMVHLERREEVSRHLVELVDRALRPRVPAPA